MKYNANNVNFEVINFIASAKSVHGLVMHDCSIPVILYIGQR